jgi:hypothetical protein
MHVVPAQDRMGSARQVPSRHLRTSSQNRYDILMIVTQPTDPEEIFCAFIPVLNLLANVLRHSEVTDMYDKDTNFSGWCEAMAQTMQRALNAMNQTETQPSDFDTQVAQVLVCLEERDSKRIEGPNLAFAKYIVQALCEHDWEVDYSGEVFKSNPPRRARYCRTCRKTDTVSVNDTRYE